MSEVGEALVGEEVFSWDGKPMGKIVSIDATVKVNYGSAFKEFDMGVYGKRRYPANRILVFKNCIEVEP